MDYVYYLANASLIIRVIQRLEQSKSTSISSLTVIHKIDGWILKVKFNRALSPREHGDFQAYMRELGVAYVPDVHLKTAFLKLDQGESPIQVMRRFQLAIVSHGNPDIRDIESFRHQFTKGLGYCPETLA
jgi:hypothetical protein